MTALELIRAKRDGEEHSEEAIRFLVEGATRKTIPDYQLAAWLMAVRLRGMTESETRALTLAMARSGRMLDLSPIPGRKVDKHSTGGVGDKATLVVAPLVAACSVPVAKLSGRALGHSGGTLDKLESIPGLRVDLTVEAFLAEVREVGIAVAGQTVDMVPADKVLYALRDTTATVDSVPLIASSVMSKKLAAGADAILLDVKCGRGAFVASLEEAVSLARSLVAVGDGAGRETVAYVTDMDQPLGRAVGNALEVKEAIETLAGGGPPDLRQLCLRLGAEMLRLAGVVKELEAGEARLARALDDGSGLRKFGDLIEAQGGDRRVCEDLDRLPQAAIERAVEANVGGVVSSLDALAVGLAAKNLGSGRERKDQPIDPSVGVVLNKKASDAVRPGDTLAVVHAGSESDAEQVAKQLTAAFTIGPRAAPRPLLLRRVSGAGVEDLTAP